MLCNQAPPPSADKYVSLNGSKMTAKIGNEDFTRHTIVQKMIATGKIFRAINYPRPIQGTRLKVYCLRIFGAGFSPTTWDPGSSCFKAFDILSSASIRNGHQIAWTAFFLICSAVNALNLGKIISVAVF